MNMSTNARSKATTKQSPSSSTRTTDEVTVPFEQLPQVADKVARIHEIVESLSSIAGEEDVTIGWHVEVTRGKDTVVLDLTGLCTLNRLLAPESIQLATDKFTDELIQKMVIPVAHYFQADANRYALELAGPAPDHAFDSLT
jgi:hypothetical protein